VSIIFVSRLKSERYAGKHFFRLLQNVYSYHAMVAVIASISVVVLAIVVAILYKEKVHRDTSVDRATSTSTAVRTNHTVDSNIEAAAVIYVIGDLHGDAECAKQWVHRTQLIHPTTREWINTSSHLIFLGDYVDKGIHSRQTIEYVKQLTDSYPQQVTALLGNHEIELLRDRSESVWGSTQRGDHIGYHQLPYATVHPREYLNYLPPDNITETDSMVVDALYNATIEVYGRGLRSNVNFVPDIRHKGSILHYIDDDHIRKVVQERLTIYQKAYLDTYRTGTVLGTWLEQRPIIKALHGTLFMHGGFSPQTATQIRTESDIEELNHQFTTHATEIKLHTFLQSTILGQTVYDIVVYRGNHKENACEMLPTVLPQGMYRLAVGHTPSSNIRINDCNLLDDFSSGASSRRKTKQQQLSHGYYENYTIFALDSALSRWFRNSGNDYCSGTHAYQSSNRQYTCHQMIHQCEGQIIRMTHHKQEQQRLVSSESSEPEQPQEFKIDPRSVYIDILGM
jgi:Calcineurin-like phosphoesterase